MVDEVQTRLAHVLLSEERGTVRQGEILFVVQGEPGDPAQRRAQMNTETATSTPVERSLAQMQVPNDTEQRQPPHEMDEPRMENGPPPMRMG